MSAWIECAARLQVADDVPAAAETIGQTRSQATAIVSPLDGWRAVWRSQAASPKSARGHDKCCTRATRTEAAHTHLVDCKEHRNGLLPR